MHIILKMVCCTISRIVDMYKGKNMWRYTLYYDNTYITEDGGYESAEEAETAAINESEYKSEIWKINGGWTDRDSLVRFSYDIEKA